jgi:hypothetical protein
VIVSPVPMMIREAAGSVPIARRSRINAARWRAEDPAAPIRSKTCAPCRETHAFDLSMQTGEASDRRPSQIPRI